MKFVPKTPQFWEPFHISRLPKLFDYLLSLSPLMLLNWFRSLAWKSNPRRSTETILVSIWWFWLQNSSLSVSPWRSTTASVSRVCTKPGNWWKITYAKCSAPSSSKSSPRRRIIRREKLGIIRSKILTFSKFHLRYGGGCSAVIYIFYPVFINGESGES